MLDEHGQPCDHLVVMRRMPEQRRLSTLAGAGAPLSGEIRAIARLLAAFHAGARRSDEITAQGGADALAAAFLDGYAEFGGDPAPASLRHHYVAYRAFVRAKVACLYGSSCEGMESTGPSGCSVLPSSS